MSTSVWSCALNIISFDGNPTDTNPCCLPQNRNDHQPFCLDVQLVSSHYKKTGKRWTPCSGKTLIQSGEHFDI
jgi:hypothetical protein